MGKDAGTCGAEVALVAQGSAVVVPGQLSNSTSPFNGVNLNRIPQIALPISFQMAMWLFSGTFEAVNAPYASYFVFCFFPFPSQPPLGLEFPWGPKPFSEVVAGPLLRNNGQTLDSSALEGSHVGVYFSAHWVSGGCSAEQLW